MMKSVVRFEQCFEAWCEKFAASNFGVQSDKGEEEWA